MAIVTFIFISMFIFYVIYMLYCMENIEVGDQGDTINVYFCMERVSYIILR